jgi:hypothetical protein
VRNFLCTIMGLHESEVLFFSGSALLAGEMLFPNERTRAGRIQFSGICCLTVKRILNGCAFSVAVKRIPLF